MTDNQQSVLNWMRAFKQVTRDSPEIPTFEERKLRALMHLEETVELVNGLGFAVNYDHTDICELGTGPDLVAIADACKDIEVVTHGTEAACGINIPKARYYDPLFEEVMYSNWTKAWTKEEKEAYTGDQLEFLPSGEPFRPWIAKNKDGKIIKSPSYTPPNLERLLK